MFHSLNETDNNISNINVAVLRNFIFRSNDPVTWIDEMIFIMMLYDVTWLIETLPPETSTPSSLTASVLMMALWPEQFCMKLPSGNFHCLMLSGDADAIVYLQWLHAIHCSLLCDSATRYIVQHTVLIARLWQDLVHSGISLMTEEWCSWWSINNHRIKIQKLASLFKNRSHHIILFNVNISMPNYWKRMKKDE